MHSDAFTTDVLDRAVRHEREAREQARLDMLRRIEPRAYFDLKTHLEGRLEREVDLVELERCRFSDSILRKGMLWMHPHSPSSPPK